MEVVVTGADGFIGRNLVSWLTNETRHRVWKIVKGNNLQELGDALAHADFVFHLAGVNRPQDEAEFRSGNVDFTVRVCHLLSQRDRPVPLMLASSVQALMNTPYGVSKLQAEEVVKEYAEQRGVDVAIYRLKNVFGKWCRPNYNSVVATFCHQVAHDLPITISDPERRIELIYVDDVVQHLLGELLVGRSGRVDYREVTPTHVVSLGELANLLRNFREMRKRLVISDMGDPFVHKLYATYLSYLSPSDFAYSLDQKCDVRGALAEFAKAPAFGQIFVSRTRAGITRGNHFHHTKTEKFLVLQGEAIIRFRHLYNNEVIEYQVCGEDFRVVDIPPGYTHSIENVGTGELVTLFWASEVLDPSRPDTFGSSVLKSSL